MKSRRFIAIFLTILYLSQSKGLINKRISPIHTKINDDSDDQSFLTTYTTIKQTYQQNTDITTTENLTRIIESNKLLFFKFLIHIFATINVFVEFISPEKLKSAVRGQCITTIILINVIEIIRSIDIDVDDTNELFESDLLDTRVMIQRSLIKHRGYILMYSLIALLSGNKAACTIPLLLSQIPFYIKYLTIYLLSTPTYMDKPKLHPSLPLLKSLLPRYIASILGLNESIDIQTKTSLSPSSSLSTPIVVDTGNTHAIDLLDSICSFAFLVTELAYFTHIILKFLVSIATHKIHGVIDLTKQCLLIFIIIQYSFIRCKYMLNSSDITIRHKIYFIYNIILMKTNELYTLVTNLKPTTHIPQATPTSTTKVTTKKRKKRTKKGTSVSNKKKDTMHEKPADIGSGADGDAVI